MKTNRAEVGVAGRAVAHLLQRGARTRRTAAGRRPPPPTAAHHVNMSSTGNSRMVLTETPWSSLEPSGAHWNPGGAHWNPVELTGTQWCSLEPSGAHWNPGGAHWNPVVLTGTQWSSLEPSGTHWNPVVLTGTQVELTGTQVELTGRGSAKGHGDRLIKAEGGAASLLKLFVVELLESY
ncbi:unnamed protein product [Arctogadus glacialis]